MRARFVAHGPRAWTLRLATPLDGRLSVVLTAPPGTLYDLVALGADGHVLATGLVSGSSQRRLEWQICGERALQLRITRHGAPGRFSLGIQKP